MAPRVLSAIMFYPRGGSAHVARALARGLRVQGCEVTLVAGSRGRPGDPGNARAFYRDVRPVDFELALRSNDPMRFDGPPGTAPIHPSFEDRPGAPDAVFARLDDLAYEHQVRAWARELERAGAPTADVLHLHHLTPLNEAADRVAPHVPVIGQLHGTELLMLERIEDGPPPEWRYAKQWAARMRGWAHRCARLLVAPGAVDRACALLELTSQQLIPLASGVDTELFRPMSVDRKAIWRRALAEDPRGSLPGEDPGSARYDADAAERLAAGTVLLYVGRFTAIKRLDVLIGAFAQARERASGPAGLVLVGGHPGESEGEHPAETVSRVGASDVFLAGWYDHDELPRLFNAADAVVLTSDREQFGLVLVEGMACARPAIAVRSPGPASVVEDGVTGWLVEPGDERALAGALVAAIDHEREREQRGRAARDVVVERYTWSEVAATLARLMRELAGTRRPSKAGEASDVRGR